MNKSSGGKKIDLLSETLNNLSGAFVDEMNRQLFTSLLMFEKPKRYYTVPRFVIRIPYLRLDREYDSEWEEGRKGLFLEWMEIPIGKKKELNTNYKEEMKRWKETPKTIKFSRYTGIKKSL